MRGVAMPPYQITSFDKEYSETEEVSYEHRAIAFIDILGWRSAVANSLEDPELRRKILNTVWALGAISRKDAEDDTPEFPSFDQVSQFSDSIAISVPLAGSLDLMRLVRQVTGYQTTMLLQGFPLRGAITVGPLYHRGSLVFGPALNEAYRLESQDACHPRVIIAKSLDAQIELARKSLPQHWPFVVRDEDGYLSTDFLTALAASRLNERVDRLLDDWLSTNEACDRVYQKYRWLKARWTTAKEDAPWREELSHRLREEAGLLGPLG
jgi:class 3 adenylate cyclase